MPTTIWVTPNEIELITSLPFSQSQKTFQQQKISEEDFKKLLQELGRAKTLPTKEEQANMLSENLEIHLDTALKLLEIPWDAIQESRTPNTQNDILFLPVEHCRTFNLQERLIDEINYSGGIIISPTGEPKGLAIDPDALDISNTLKKIETTLRSLGSSTDLLTYNPEDEED